MDLYLRPLLPQSEVQIDTTSLYRLATMSKELCVVARKPLKVDMLIHHLSGNLSPFDPEHHPPDFFSVLRNSQGREYVLLGPARFVNHDCDPNVQMEYRGGDHTIAFRVIKAILPGEEILGYYGRHYFGTDNVDCLCQTCQNDRLLYHRQQASDSDAGHFDSSDVPEQSRPARARSRRSRSALSYQLDRYNSTRRERHQRQPSLASDSHPSSSSVTTHSNQTPTHHPTDAGAGAGSLSHLFSDDASEASTVTLTRQPAVPIGSCLPAAAPKYNMPDYRTPLPWLPPSLMTGVPTLHTYTPFCTFVYPDCLPPIHCSITSCPNFVEAETRRDVIPWFCRRCERHFALYADYFPHRPCSTDASDDDRAPKIERTLIDDVFGRRFDAYIAGEPLPSRHPTRPTRAQARSQVQSRARSVGHSQARSRSNSVAPSQAKPEIKSHTKLSLKLSARAPPQTQTEGRAESKADNPERSKRSIIVRKRPFSIETAIGIGISQPRSRLRIIS